MLKAILNIIRKPAVIMAAVVVLLLFLGYRFIFGAAAVETVAVQQGAVEELVHGPAKIRARVPVSISSRFAAEIIDVTVDIGERVHTGQVLVRLDSRELQARSSASHAMLARAEADLALAQSNEQRDREVFKQGYISRAAMEATSTLRKLKQAEVAVAREELAYAATQAAHATLTAPMNGIVTARLSEPGDNASPGAPILRMVDPRTLQAVAMIDETVAGRITSGMSALIRKRTGGTSAGRVSRIQLEADAAAREFQVEVDFVEIPDRFAIDQEAEVTITIGRANGLVIPVTALQQKGGLQGVLALRNGRAMFQAVETGTSDGKRILVRKGIRIGEQLVRNAAGVKPGSRVRAKAGE
jgi:RND family efflux transporter MFP subunit